MVDYTYSIANDTVNGLVNPDDLEEEILASSISSATFQNLDTGFPNTDDIVIEYDVTLSGADITTLNGVVVAHQGLAPAAPSPLIEHDNEGGGTTQSNAWQDSINQTTPQLRRGRYKVEWYGEIRITSGGAGEVVEFRSTRGATELGFTSDNRAAWHSYSGHKFVNVGPRTAVTLKLQWRIMGGTTGTAEIRRARISIDKIGPPK
jgi:hypothetical protein